MVDIHVVDSVYILIVKYFCGCYPAVAEFVVHSDVGFPQLRVFEVRIGYCYGSLGRSAVGRSRHYGLTRESVFGRYVCKEHTVVSCLVGYPYVRRCSGEYTCTASYLKRAVAQNVPVKTYARGDQHLGRRQFGSIYRTAACEYHTVCSRLEVKIGMSARRPSVRLNLGVMVHLSCT